VNFRGQRAESHAARGLVELLGGELTIRPLGQHQVEDLVGVLDHPHLPTRRHLQPVLLQNAVWVIEQPLLEGLVLPRLGYHLPVLLRLLLSALLCHHVTSCPNSRAQPRPRPARTGGGSSGPSVAPSARHFPCSPVIGRSHPVRYQYM